MQPSVVVARRDHDSSSDGVGGVGGVGDDDRDNVGCLEWSNVVEE